MRIQTIFRFKLGIRRVRGKEWASDQVGRENMSHHENLIDLMRTALKIRNIVTRKKFPIIGPNFARTLTICYGVGSILTYAEKLSS